MRQGIGTCPSLLPPATSLTLRRKLDPLFNALVEAWSRIVRVRAALVAARSSRRLKVVETVCLGEKRFVSILNIDGQELLLGGSPSSVVVLANLEGSRRICVPLASPVPAETGREKQFIDDTRDPSERAS